MTIEERQEAAKWFQNRASHTAMPGTTMMFKRAAEALSEGIQPHWIPCSERLPEEDGEYITTVEDGEGMFVTSNDWRQDWKQWGFWTVDEEYNEVWRRVTNVVAWMPLPEPWKEGHDEQTD